MANCYSFTEITASTWPSILYTVCCYDEETAFYIIHPLSNLQPISALLQILLVLHITIV